MKELLRKFQLITSLALGSAPVAVLVFALLGPSLLPFAWIYPVAYGVLCFLSAWVVPKGRLFFGIVVSAAAMLLPVLLAEGATKYPLLIVSAFYVALFLWSLVIFGWAPNRELPDRLRLICVVLHVIAQFVISMDRAEAQPLLTAQAPGLHATFVAFLLLLPFSMNRDSINNATTHNRPVPDSMRRKNTWMTAVLVALAGLASFVPYIYDWIKEALFWFVRILMRLLNSEPSEPAGTPVTIPPETVGEAIPVIEPEQGPLAQILEAVMMILGAFVVVGVLITFTVLLARKLMRWMKKVWSKLEQYAAAVAEDYEDEITDIRKESLGERIAAKRRGAFWQREQIPAQPVENIRYRYRRLLRKHPQWTADTTARENMPRELAELYEKARYSNHAVTEKEAEQFHTGTKDLR